jgi:TetR/AcrR family transcriptional regulator, transcriptional repressor for nem operon
MLTFWTNGFDGTTLALLEQATGVDRSTLYNSFGGKEGLFEAAASHYSGTMGEMLLPTLRDGTRGLADVLAFLQLMREGTQSGAYPSGCFMFNCMTADRQPKAAAAYLDDLGASMRHAFSRAEAAGDIPPGTAHSRATMIVAAVVGYNIANRTQANRDEAIGMMDAIIAVVSAWTRPGA